MPLHGVLAIDVSTAFLAIFCLLLVQIPQPKSDTATGIAKASVWADMQDGFRYVWRWSGLRKVIALAILINAISIPAFTLLPLLVTKEFGGGAIEIATMQSSFAVGFLVGGLLLAVWGGFRRKIVTATLAIFGSAIGMLLVGTAPNTAFWAAASGIFIAGVMSVLTNGPTFALLQTIVEENMQGRVMALVVSLANAFTPLGLVISGPLAEVNGIRLWFLITCGVFIFAGLFILGNADVRNIENHQAQAALTETNMERTI
jgi:DHA3 family macrolide efflux protein-like MFS transporter